MNNNLEQSEHSPKGLTELEVKVLQKKFGKNEVAPSSLSSGPFEYLRFFKDPMGVMLLALALIYFLLGEKKDAIIIS